MAKSTPNLEIRPLISILFSVFLLTSSAFQSDELLVDDEEFGLEGGVRTRSLDLENLNPIRTPAPQSTTRKRSADHDSDSKVQFLLEHAFGDADFAPAGTFSARLKTWNHGGQTLTKLRFSRDDFTELEKEMFEKLLEDDDFYRIRLPSHVLSPPGKDYVLSSVKARCLARDSLDEHFVIHTEGVNILGVNYGSPASCQYPRPLHHPKKWIFKSHTVLKSSEQAPRAPVFTEDIFNGETVEGDLIPPPERTFWAKYWMYLIPLGLIVMNGITQTMNMPEEQGAGQPPTQATAAVRRR